MPIKLINRLLKMSFTLHNKRLLRWLILNVRLYALICVAGYFLFANKLSAQQENEIEPSPDDVVVDLVHVDIRKHEALYQVPLNLARVINDAEVFIYNEDNGEYEDPPGIERMIDEDTVTSMPINSGNGRSIIRLTLSDVMNVNRLLIQHSTGEGNITVKASDKKEFIENSNDPAWQILVYKKKLMKDKIVKNEFTLREIKHFLFIFEGLGDGEAVAEIYDIGVFGDMPSIERIPIKDDRDPPAEIKIYSMRNLYETIDLADLYIGGHIRWLTAVEAVNTSFYGNDNDLESFFVMDPRNLHVIVTDLGLNRYISKASIVHKSRSPWKGIIEVYTAEKLPWDDEEDSEKTSETTTDKNKLEVELGEIRKLHFGGKVINPSSENIGFEFPLRQARYVIWVFDTGKDQPPQPIVKLYDLSVFGNYATPTFRPYQILKGNDEEFSKGIIPGPNTDESVLPPVADPYLGQ